MKAFRTYLQKQKSEYLQQQYPTDFAADIIIVIPCYNEHEVGETIQSLLCCNRPKVNVLVAVIVNSGENADTVAVERNRKTYDEMVQLAAESVIENTRFFPLLFENLPKKHAGVGLARKIGMDLAVEHFDRHEKEHGIIVSLDADCTVSDNYLTKIDEAFRQNRKLSGTIHNFHHRPENNDPILENAVRQYETYIRYFSKMLQLSGFPYYFHTIGSAFAVTADTYVRVGGMGRQQGGEDFYFLQKVFALGEVELLDDVFVYPMARSSDRVPFGTGPALQKIIDEPSGTMQVYSAQSFQVLKQFFKWKDVCFKKEASDIKLLTGNLHQAMIDFIENDQFLESILDCNRNTATLLSYQKRFFYHFNALKIIKFLNFAHSEHFEKESLSMH